MIKIYDGKTQFYQWDINQKLTVDNPDIKELHFTNAAIGKALVVEVINGTANVPNILLQYDFDIKAYGFCGECVRDSAVFNVIGRAKPEDYVYTETEIKTWDSLKEELEAEIDKQIEAGIEEIKSQSVASDMYSNALKGAASGSAVTLNVSPIEHTLEVKARSKNLFDINKVVDVKQSGAYIEVSGNDIIFTYGTLDTNHFAFSCEVDVTPNTDYVLSIGNTTSITRYYVYIDYLFGKALKTNVDINTGVFNSGNNRKLVIGFYSIQPQRVGASEVISNIMLEEGIKSTSYTPYVDISKEIIIPGSKNLFDITKATVNTKLSVGSGEIETNSQFTTSDYIAIQPNTAFVGNHIQYCAFYDKDKKYISDIGEKSSTVERALTMPQNAYYIRFTFKKSVTDGSNTQIELGTKSTSYTPYVEEVTTANVIQIGNNILPYPYAMFANEDTRVLAGITYTNNKDGGIHIKGTSTDTGLFTLGNIDLGNSYIDASSGADSKTNGTYTISKFLVYEHTTKRVRIGVKTGLTVDEVVYPQINYGNKLLPYEPYTETPYPIGKDGAVDNITSFYPVTTLTTDTPGVVIDVKYNKDINKAFEELIQAIISLGGNI